MKRSPLVNKPGEAQLRRRRAGTADVCGCGRSGPQRVIGRDATVMDESTRFVGRQTGRAGLVGEGMRTVGLFYPVELNQRTCWHIDNPS